MSDWEVRGTFFKGQLYFEDVFMLIVLIIENSSKLPMKSFLFAEL